MENSSLKTSSVNGNRAYVMPSPQTQPVQWSEAQSDDWDLRQILTLAKRRALVITGVMTAVMIAVVAVTLSQRAVYEAKFRILAEPVNNDNSNLPKLTFEQQNFNKSSLDYETQIQVLKSPELMTDIVKQLQYFYPEIDYNSLVYFLTITRLGETKIIEVRYRSNDSVKTKAVLEKLAQAYLKYSLENRQTNLRQGIKFVEKQLPSIQTRVNELQQQLQVFRQKYDFNDPQAQSLLIGEQFKLLSEQRLAINQQLAKAQANFNNLHTTEGSQAVLSTPVYQNLTTQLRQLEVQTAYELTRFQEDSRPIQDLQEKQQRLLPLLRKEAQRAWNTKLAEVNAEIQTLQNQSQVLAQTENNLHRKVEQLPILTRQYTELQRSLQIANESLNRFLTTYETLQIELAQTQIPWQLVQAPTQPENSTSPNIPRSLLLGLVASTILGIGSGLLTEKLDNTYHTVDALRDKLKLPLLATIPFERQVSNNQKLAVAGNSPGTSAELPEQDHPKLAATLPRWSKRVKNYQDYETSRFLEALRLLYTNIQLLSSDQPMRSIVISSAMPAEGKSTIAFHLAQTACAMGQRVLLVDADLRRPRVHTLVNLNNLWGLSNLITGSMPVETVIQQMPAFSELSVITAGLIPPDPTKLLTSQKMKQLMADFHKNFDLVIYDAPPLVGLADTNLLAPRADGIVLVARIHKTDRTALTQAMESLRMSHSNVLGVVINGDNTHPTTYYHY